jgi:two-component system nitrate/nitrite sensor histidine kinase NarX
VKVNRKYLKANSSSLSVRWVAAGISLLVIFGFIGVLWIWPQNNLFLSVLFSLGIAGVIYFIAGRFIQMQSEMLSLQSRIDEIEVNASNIKRRADAVLELSRKFVEATDEREVVSSLLNVIMDLVGAIGASVVPLDERGQPLTAISFGEIPTPLMESWVEYLASPEIRHKCATCQKTGTLVQNCPLIEVQVYDVPNGIPPTGVYCLHLSRGDREYGVLNLYLPQDKSLDNHTQEFLETLLGEAALVLESIRLKNREVAVLQQFKSHTDLKTFELEFIKNVQDALDADFVLLQYKLDEKKSSQKLTSGEIPKSDVTLVDGLIDTVLMSESPVLIGEVDGDQRIVKGINSLIAAPLTLTEEPALGVILAGNSSTHKFNSRHLALLQSLAGQVSLVVQNSEYRAEMEFNTIIAERTRLAREIHDGLAQTLGFLKLQAAQMENMLAANEKERLQESLTTTYKVLSDAYLDVRQAIDGLRISPNGEGLSAWLKETCLEFEENTGLPVSLDEFPLDEDLPPEFQVQLIRIVQEALSNVRKHACASQAWVSYHQNGQDFIIEVRDNGCGFSLEEIPSVSRYGLQGMRERSELIGADFQVISKINEGTQVRIRVPIPKGKIVQ